MSQLSDESIRGFKELFERRGGKSMTWDEASEAANRLVDFYLLLAKIDQRTGVTETPEKVLVDSQMSQIDPDQDASAGR